jgi:hypothetical protein
MVQRTMLQGTFDLGFLGSFFFQNPEVLGSIFFESSADFEFLESIFFGDSVCFDYLMSNCFGDSV